MSSPSNNNNGFTNETKNASGFTDAPKTGGRRSRSTRRRTNGGRRSWGHQ